MNKEASGQIKTIVEGITERVAKEVLGRVVLGLLNNDGHCFSKRPCTTCQTVSELVQQPFGCVRKAQQRTESDEYKAIFLWAHKKGSIKEAGWKFANAETEAYRKQWWDILVELFKKEAT